MHTWSKRSASWLSSSSVYIRQEKSAISGGVGLDARGYSLLSRDSRGVGLLTKTWGNFRVKRVVVVTVLVSTHSLISSWKRLGLSRPFSEMLTDMVWEGVFARLDSPTVLPGVGVIA